MRKKIVRGFAGVFVYVLMFGSSSAYAQSPNEILSYLKPSLEIQVEHLIDLLHRSFVGIGISFYDSNALVDSKEIRVIMVTRVIKNSPASISGVQVGDTILSVNGKPISTKEEFLKNIVGDGKAGNKVTLELIRKFDKITIQTTTASFGNTENRKPIAAILETNIRTTSKIAIADVMSVAETIIQKIKANPNFELSDADNKLFNDAMYKFRLWVENNRNEVEKIIVPE